VDYIESVIEMMIDELMAVLQDPDSSDGTTTKQYFIT